MIPDFKTYIKESVWGDIRKRAEGNLDRKEDLVDVNSMSKDEFVSYLKDRYECDDDCITAPNIKTHIYVKVFHCNLDPKTDTCVLNIGPYKTNMIGFTERLKVHMSDIFTKKMMETINGQYRAYHDGGLRDLDDPIRIEPMDYREKESNEFFVEVIDFLIKNHDRAHQPLLRKK